MFKEVSGKAVSRKCSKSGPARLQGFAATGQDVQNGLWRGRSERKPEAYYLPYVEGLSEARTKSQGIFNILKRKGATGFDGDTDTTVACRALGDSLTPGKCNCQSRTGTRSLIKL